MSTYCLNLLYRDRVLPHPFQLLTASLNELHISNIYAVNRRGMTPFGKDNIKTSVKQVERQLCSDRRLTVRSFKQGN
jgi:hypothetical protein